MLDIKWIRENSQKFDEAMKARSAKFFAKDILLLDEEKRQKTFLIQDLQAKRNQLAKDIAKLKQTQTNTEILMAEAKIINEKLAQGENDFEVDEKINALLLSIPNIADSTVPIGESEEQNKVVEVFGKIRHFDFPIKAHDELGEALKMLDFEQSALMSGARFSTLSKDLARLERALSNFIESCRRI